MNEDTDRIIEDAVMTTIDTLRELGLSDDEIRAELEARL